MDTKKKKRNEQQFFLLIEKRFIEKIDRWKGDKEEDRKKNHKMNWLCMSVRMNECVCVHKTTSIDAAVILNQCSAYLIVNCGNVVLFKFFFFYFVRKFDYPTATNERLQRHQPVTVAIANNYHFILIMLLLRNWWKNEKKNKRNTLQNGFDRSPLIWREKYHQYVFLFCESI